MSNRYRLSSPTNFPSTLWREIEIGVEYTIEEIVLDDGTIEAKIVPTVDADGNPVFKRYRVKVARTVKDTLEMAERVMQVLAAYLGEIPDSPAAWDRLAATEDANLDVIACVLGSGDYQAGVRNLMQIYNDPTVTSKEFESFCEQLLEITGFDDVISELTGDAANFSQGWTPATGGLQLLLF